MKSRKASSLLSIVIFSKNVVDCREEYDLEVERCFQ